MRLAMIGLGRMGANIARRLIRGGHQIVGFDANTAVLATLAGEGLTPAPSLEELLSTIAAPRVFWVMLPAGLPTDSTIKALIALASPGDMIIDGGNSFYKDAIRRAKACAASNLHYVDVSTSGGIWGLERGYCMMIGGEARAIQQLAPLFDLCAAALTSDHELSEYSGQVADSGEGQWTIDAAMEQAVPAYVLSAALFARYRSRQDATYGKLLSAMLAGFRGHVETPQ